MLLYYKKLRSKDYLEALEVVIQNYPDQKLLKATKLCLTLMVQVTLGTFTNLLNSLLEQTYKIRDEIEYCIIFIKTWSARDFSSTLSPLLLIKQESMLMCKFLEESYGESIEKIDVLFSTLNELKSEIKNSGGLTERPKVQFSGLISCISLAAKVDPKEFQDLTLKEAKEEGLD
ncbi:hypothetical protein PPACK8108_LOCUS11717 [Phakopsora pachyrhizi]|uniref:Uncharacterized protein n=1 Tax=Phakopsora pachyrhizi TaxID=170000 RepID=A0AAV0B2K3_PHAPC|nr:hypothetical protein PPACK8108_LOCUS11717 [Phakopsora pachyrhizi]